MEMLIHHHFSSGVYAKETRIPAGHYLVQHIHSHDHLSILASGSIELLVDGNRQTITAPACITISAGKHHAVRSLTDVVWYCVHATDCTDADEVDAVLIEPANEAAVKALTQALEY